MGLLRGPAHRQRPPWAAPRVGPRLQGPLPAVPDHAGSRRPSQGRVGLPRPPRGARGRTGARPVHQARDRGLRHRGLQPALPRLSAALRGGLVGPHHPVRHLDRHRRRLLDPQQRLRRVRLVAGQAAVGRRAALRGPPGHPLLLALRDGAVIPRGGPGLQGCHRPVDLRALPGHFRPGGGRRSARVDDHPLDADLQRGRRRGPRPVVRPHRRPRRRS